MDLEQVLPKLWDCMDQTKQLLIALEEERGHLAECLGGDMLRACQNFYSNLIDELQAIQGEFQRLIG